MPGPLLIDPEGIFANVKRILREMQEFPAAAEVAVSEGGSSKVTDAFRDEVGYAAAAMADSTRQITEAMTAMQETIRSVVELLVENDASLADETKVLLSLLDSAADQPAAEDESKKSDYA